MRGDMGRPPEPKHPERHTKKQVLGKTAVFNAFQEHQLALRRFISRIVRRPSDIDDIAQEAFLRAYHAEKNSDNEIEKPKSFLFKIAHNVAITNLTRKSNQMMDYLADIDELSDAMLSPSLVDEAIAQQVVGIHCEAVAALPSKCRRVYLMRKVHGMSHRDIAMQLGISQRTVEKHIGKGARDCANYVQQRQADISSNAFSTVNAATHMTGVMNNE